MTHQEKPNSSNFSLLLASTNSPSSIDQNIVYYICDNGKAIQYHSKKVVMEICRKRWTNFSRGIQGPDSFVSSAAIDGKTLSKSIFAQPLGACYLGTAGGRNTAYRQFTLRLLSGHCQVTGCILIRTSSFLWQLIDWRGRRGRSSIVTANG